MEKSDSRSWLQRLKEESWEAELLISAVAIVGVINLFDLIHWAVNFFIDTLLPENYFVAHSIVFGGLLSVSILATMFVIHFSLRAYWVGLVGLNSVFPDYGLEDSAYSEIYTKKMMATLPKLKETIAQVDELCSLIYSAAFFMLMVYLYISLVASLYLYLFLYLSEYVQEYVLLIPLYLVILLTFFLVLFGIIANFKKLKQNEAIQSWYFQFSKWSSMIMFGPLYKYIMQISLTFASNFRKKKALIVLNIVFIIVGYIITITQVDKTNLPYLASYPVYFDDTRIHSGYYRSQSNKEDFLLTPQIESDRINRDLVQLFIPVYRHEKQFFNSICGDYQKDKSKTRNEQLKEQSAWYLSCYKAYHQVFLNGEELLTDLMKYSFPESNQSGVTTYLNIEHANKGKNTIRVVKNIGEEHTEWTIPFQYIPD